MATNQHRAQFMQTWRPRTTLAASTTLVALFAAACGGGSSSQAANSTSSATAPTSATAPSSSPTAAALSGQRLTLMIQGSGDVSQVVEAHAMKLLKEQGVKTDIQYNSSSTNVAIAELRSGTIDIFGAGLTSAIGAVGAGIPLVDFALAEPRQDYVFLARKGINTLADLKGKKIGVQDTTGVNYAQALLVLQKAGISVKDVSIVPTGGQSVRLPALVSGRVDATMLGHNAELKLAGKGYTTLFDYTRDASTLYDDNFYATKSWLGQHKALAVAVNKALLDSFVWFSNPSNSDAVVQEALAISPADDKAKTATLFTILRKLGAYPPGVILDKQAVAAQQTLYVQAGAATKSTPVDQWVDTSYAEQAKAMG